MTQAVTETVPGPTEPALTEPAPGPGRRREPKLARICGRGAPATRGHWHGGGLGPAAAARAFKFGVVT